MIKCCATCKFSYKKTGRGCIMNLHNKCRGGSSLQSQTELSNHNFEYNYWTPDTKDDFLTDKDFEI